MILIFYMLLFVNEYFKVLIEHIYLALSNNFIEK